MNVKIEQDYSLTESQVQEFEQTGKLTFKLDISDESLDQIVQAVDEHYEYDRSKPAHFGTRLQDGWHKVPGVFQLATHPQALAALRQLFGREPLPFQTLNFPIGTAQAVHSDTIHFNSIPSGFMAGVWVALEDIDENNGPLIYYPGSHKLRELSMQDLGLEPGYANYRFYEEAMQDVIVSENLKPELGTMCKGSALIWHANLMHGGAPHKDPSRSRHSQVTHYFFEDCRYYTPMNSSETRIQYREPEWIREYDSTVPARPGLARRVLRRLKRLAGAS